MKRLILFAGCALLLLLNSSTFQVQAQGVVLPSGFVDTHITGGLVNPVTMQFAPDGRLFVAQQGGSLRVVQNDVLLSTPFMSLSVTTSAEGGLLGIAFDPNFLTNSYIYVYYTTPTAPIHNRISRFTANGNTVVPGSEVVIMNLDNVTSGAHYAGALHFGPDGKLYIATGEDEVPNNSQLFTNVLGKILRINRDGTIPTDNPFYATTTGNNRSIWALGLRNPFSFAFQPGTGRMLINDVGGAPAYEEINGGRAGANYGWPQTDGPFDPTTYPNFDLPLYAYPHTGTPTPCAIVGADFYNPTTVQFPSDYVGDYFFADYCGMWIKRYDPVTNTVSNFASNTVTALADVKVSPGGSLYYVARNGSLDRIDYGLSGPPVITQNPTNLLVTAGEPATFTCQASGQLPISYQWQRSGTDIPGATASSYTLSSTTLSDTGAAFRCRATNSFGSATSTAATLTVVAGNPPTATITQPIAGTLYSGGDTINYAGTGSDPEDGTLPPSAFTWQVDFHHLTHLHPFIPATSGMTSGSFVIPTIGETSPIVWYRILLTVTDSTGLTYQTYRDVLPRKVTFTLATTPPGLQLYLDGTPHATPFSVVGVVGIIRNLEAPSPQNSGGTTWFFDSWSDGGAANHNISTPTVDTTYSARFISSSAAPSINYYTTATPTLTWNRVTWATGYQIQVDNNADFSSPAYSNIITSGAILAQTMPTGPLHNGTWYWRVRARHSDGTWGTWSAAGTFVIEVP